MIPLIQLETERTLLRNLTPADAADFYALNQDPEVLKYTGDIPFESEQVARRFLEHYDQYEKYGVGRLAVIHKQSSCFMGWCGLKYSTELNEFDIGFRFLKSYWNQGYATETAKRCLAFAFNERKLNKVVGRAILANKASIRVLEKIGMELKEEVHFDEHPGCIYQLTKAEYHN